MTTERSWELFSAQLKSFFAARVADEQAAEDLLQETFLRVHATSSGLADEERVAAWIFRIARNLLVDYRRGRAASTVADEDVALQPDTRPAPENLNGVVRAWLPAMIAQLPETYRSAVELFELEGLSQQAIAKRLGLSLSGAKSRIQRGRELLRSQLLDCCSFERDRRGNIIDYARRGPGGCDPVDSRAGTGPRRRR